MIRYVAGQNASARSQDGLSAADEEGNLMEEALHSGQVVLESKLLQILLPPTGPHPVSECLVIDQCAQRIRERVRVLEVPRAAGWPAT